MGAECIEREFTHAGSPVTSYNNRLSSYVRRERPLWAEHIGVYKHVKALIAGVNWARQRRPDLVVTQAT